MLENIGQIIIAILIIGVALYFFIWFYFNTQAGVYLSKEIRPDYLSNSLSGKNKQT